MYQRVLNVYGTESFSQIYALVFIQANFKFFETPCISQP